MQRERSRAAGKIENRERGDVVSGAAFAANGEALRRDKFGEMFRRVKSPVLFVRLRLFGALIQPAEQMVGAPCFRRNGFREPPPHSFERVGVRERRQWRLEMAERRAYCGHRLPRGEQMRLKIAGDGHLPTGFLKTARRRQFEEQRFRGVFGLLRAAGNLAAKRFF